MPSHGSLSKAGKMQLNPDHKRQWRVDEKGRKRRNMKKHKDPMRRNRQRYKKMLLNAKAKRLGINRPPSL